jgi:predicted amidohydrolase YtcJ
MKRISLGAVAWLLIGTVLLGCSALALASAPSLIFYGGTVIPMTDEHVSHEAVAIAANSILALGSDDDILAMADAATQLVNLGGRVVLPGFIDPHTHLFDHAHFEGMTFDEVQQMAIENGITTAANMHSAPSEGQSWEVDDFIAYASTGAMRIRLHLYMIHTNSCGGDVGFWYEQYAPDEEIAPRLHMGGVKLFAERSSCGNQAIIFNFSAAIRENLTEKGKGMWEDAWLFHTEDELADILRRVQSKGYQAAIHALGDLAIDTCLNAYERILDGQPNELRHMILHNWFLRDDMLPRYAEIGVLALIEMSSPASLELYSRYVGEENLHLFRRWNDLLAAGAHVALDSDWPYFPINPIDKLRAFVGGENMDSGLASLGPCEDRASQLIETWQALQMMTVNAAYALRCEDTRGTLEPGKLADLVVLSENPLVMDPACFSNLRIQLTMIDGKIEWSNLTSP